jgi:DnaK suppressor protein
VDVSDDPLGPAQARAVADEIARRRRRTRTRRAQLARDVEALVAATHDAPDDEHDPEGATIGFERQQAAALLAEADQHLRELARAADELDAGRLGRCARCGRGVGVDRLLARPTARTCVRCAD